MDNFFKSIPYISKEFIVNLANNLLDVGLEVLNLQDITIQLKSDQSPVTNGDIMAHKKIESLLHKLTPDIPLVSEENIKSQSIHTDHTAYWLLDPIDGTSSFIKGLGHYVISLGLIVNHKSFFGMLCHPPTMQVFYGGSYIPFSIYPNSKYTDHSNSNNIISAITNSSKPPIQHTPLYVTRSALKYVKMVLKRPSFFYSTHPNYPWDLAGGHALLKSMNGNIFDLAGKELLYIHNNKKYDKYIATLGIPFETALYSGTSGTGGTSGTETLL